MPPLQRNHPMPHYPATPPSSSPSLSLSLTPSPPNEMEQLSDLLLLRLHSLLAPVPFLLPSHFFATRVPDISLGGYLDRIMEYCPTSSSAWILSFIYISRLLEKWGAGFLHEGSVHRVVLASVVLASKFCDDKYKKNSFYALVGGVTREEMNALEVELLERLEYRLYVSTEEFQEFRNELYHEVEPFQPTVIPVLVCSSSKEKTNLSLSSSSPTNSPSPPSSPASPTTEGSIETIQIKIDLVDHFDNNNSMTKPKTKAALSGKEACLSGTIGRKGRSCHFSIASSLRQLSSLFA